MSLLELLGLSKKSGTASNRKRYYIVDGGTLDSNSSDRQRLSPRNQMDMLRRLSRFVKREKVELCVIFEGKALNDAPDGKKHQDVMVYYAPQKTSYRIGQLCDEKRGWQVLVITTDKNVESETMRKNGELMHSTTFKKALESDGSNGGRERFSGQKDNGRRSNGNRKSQRRSGNKQQSQKKESNGAEKTEQQQPAPAASAPAPREEKPKEAHADNPASEVIDLL